MDKLEAIINETSRRDSYCVFTNMTNAEKKQVQESWLSLVGPLIEDDEKVEEFGREFVFWVLELSPKARKAFKKFDARSSKADLSKNVVFNNHCRMVGSWIGQMVVLLNKPVELEMLTHQLAINHLLLRPKIGSEYFDPIQENFTKFMANKLQKPVDDPLVILWGKLMLVFTAKVKKSEKLIAQSKKCTIS